MNDQPIEDRFIDDAEEERLTSLSRTTRWRLRQAGQFPVLYELSGNRRGSRLSEIVMWMKTRQRVA